MEAQKQMDSWEYKYSPDQYVFTEHSASKNLPPLKILGRSRTGNNLMFEGEPWVSKKIIDPETGKAMRTPYEPGYKVRREHGDDWSEFTIPETAIKGLVEPDEPYRKGGAVHMQDGGLPIRAHNREFETPDLMNARDIGVTGDYEGKALTLGKQQMRRDYEDATKLKRDMDYIRYSQPFREGRVSAMAMKDPSNPIYQGMLQYEQPMMGGSAGIGLMGMRTPEEDYKLKALQLMYQQKLGKDGNLSGFVGMPFGGKPMGGVQYRGRFAEGGIVDDYIKGFPMGSRFVQKQAPQPVAVQAKPKLDNFEHALGFVLPHEGGYNNRKGDSPTNYGIKQSVYSDYLGRPATIDDIKNMPMEHAKEIYRKQYWNPIEEHGLDLKPSVVAFDAAVNQGPTFARSMIGSTQGDIEKMLEARQQRYNEVIKNNPSKRRFKAGWDNRMNAVRNYAMEDYHAKGGKISTDDMKIALLRNK
jgi:hypothetical protein